tara:strand:- start:254 stop:436 length:183 start_codon:yes stop_codon:yes gene_type:complete
MELTIEQALRKGIEAHKVGQLQEAERLYRAILQSQPLHPVLDIKGFLTEDSLWFSNCENK